MKASSKFLLCGLVLLCITCDMYEFPESPYPRIETLPVVNITEAGVTFQGNIIQLGKTDIINHGFVWDTENFPTIGHEKVELGATNSKGRFDADVQSGLNGGELYTVRAFVATADYFVYGPSVTFTSKGSSSPVIKSFSPDTGTVGDLVTIKGSHFSAKNSSNDVKFGTENATVTSSTDSTISCIVPDNIPVSAPIFVSVSGKLAQSPKNFEVVAPKITDFEPKSGTFGDLVTINGTNFSRIPEKNDIRFNGKVAQVVNVSDGVIIARVPAAVVDKENSITIEVNNQVATSNTKFTILPPSISSISSNSGSFGETIEINGDNFNPVQSGNIVLFGGAEATIASSAKNKLTVQVPNGIYSSRVFKIEVRIAEQSAFSDEFTLQEAWIRKADLPLSDLPSMGPRRYGATAFAANGYGYAGLGGDGIDDSIYKFDPSENSWTKATTFPGGARGFAVSFVIDDKVYIGLGTDADPYIGAGPFRNDLWRYDPQTNTWEKMADFPMDEGKQGFGFSANGKGYLVGFDWSDNFWEYDPVLNSWTQKADLEYAERYYQDAAFVVNNKIFVTRVDENYKASELWEYNVSSNSWMERTGLADSEYARVWSPMAKGFNIGTDGYLIISNSLRMYKYNSTSGSWQQVSSCPDGGIYPLAFVLNGKAYYGTGNNTGVDIWEYDPEFEQ